MNTNDVHQLKPAAAQSYAYFYPTAGATRRQRRPALAVAAPGAGRLQHQRESVHRRPPPVNQVDRNLKAPLTSELLFSVRHALLPEFTVGLNLARSAGTRTSRRTTSWSSTATQTRSPTCRRRSRRATRNDYVVVKTLTGTLPNGGTYSVPVYGLKDGVTTRGGTILRNGDDYGQDYKGLAVVLTKRLQPLDRCAATSRSPIEVDRLGRTASWTRPAR